MTNPELFNCVLNWRSSTRDVSRVTMKKSNLASFEAQAGKHFGRNIKRRDSSCKNYLENRRGAYFNMKQGRVIIFFRFNGYLHANMWFDLARFGQRQRCCWNSRISFQSFYLSDSKTVCVCTNGFASLWFWMPLVVWWAQSFELVSDDFSLLK